MFQFKMYYLLFIVSLASSTGQAREVRLSNHSNFTLRFHPASNLWSLATLLYSEEGGDGAESRVLAPGSTMIMKLAKQEDIQLYFAQTQRPLESYGPLIFNLYASAQALAKSYTAHLANLHGLGVGSSVGPVLAASLATAAYAKSLKRQIGSLIGLGCQSIAAGNTSLEIVIDEDEETYKITAKAMPVDDEIDDEPTCKGGAA